EPPQTFRGPSRDWLPRRSFQAGDQPAAFLVRAGFSSSGHSSMSPVSAPLWHAAGTDVRLSMRTTGSRVVQGHGSLRTPMGKANHLRPIHTGGTTSITTRREPAENKTATRAADGRGTGILMAANRASLVMGSAAAHGHGSLQSRRNKTVAGILEEQSDGDGGA